MVDVGFRERERERRENGGYRHEEDKKIHYRIRLFLWTSSNLLELYEGTGGSFVFHVRLNTLQLSSCMSSCLVSDAGKGVEG